MQNLSLELKSVIAENLRTLEEEEDGKEDLAALRLVSKDFASSAAPSLFRVLNLSQQRGSTAAVMRILEERPHFAVFVKEIYFVVEHSSWSGPDDLDTLDQSASIFTRLNSFSALEILHLIFPSHPIKAGDVGLSDSEDEGSVEDDTGLGTSTQSDMRKLQIKIFTALASLSGAPKTLREFEINGLIPQPNKGLRMEGLKAFLQGIQHLSIIVATNADKRVDGAVPVRGRAYRHFWRNDIVNLLAGPTDLTRFELLSDFAGGGIGPNCNIWDSLNWPKLQSLRLRGIIFNETYKDGINTLNDPLAITGVEAFIQRHTSLQQLALEKCFLNINFPDVPNARMWSDVFKGFEEKLANLYIFAMTPSVLRPYAYGNNARGEGYVRPCIRNDYNILFRRGQAPPAEDAYLDDMALETLKYHCDTNRFKF